MLELEQLKDGDIVECYVYNKSEQDWFDFFDGVFNKNDCKLLMTNENDNFDFNNNSYCNVEYKFNIIENINNYNFREKEIELKDVFDYLINKGFSDISYQIQDTLNADLGYFVEYPVNVVEIRDGLISCIFISRGEAQDDINQNKLEWLYYLKDMKIKIKI